MSRRELGLRSAGGAAVLLGSLAVWAMAPTNGGFADEGPAERRARIESLPAAQKQELWENEERFLKLDRAEQERLRQLSREVETDPEGPELRRVMQRYYDWLKTLPPYQRAELQGLSPEDRVRRIQAILADQSRKAGRGGVWGEFARREWRISEFPGGPKRPPSRLDPADWEGLFTWLDGYVKGHTKEILEKIPPAHRDRVERELAQRTDPVRRQELIGWIWLWWQLDSRGKLPSLSDRETADLLSKLSPATRKKLESLPATAQRRAVAGLFSSFMLHQDAARHADVRLPSASEEELAQFFERELKPEERERLLSLSGEEMQQALWRMYLRWKIPRLPPPGSGWEKRPDAPGPRPGTQDAPWQPGPSDLPSRGARPRRQQQGSADKKASSDAVPNGQAPSVGPAKKPKDKTQRPGEQGSGRE